MFSFALNADKADCSAVVLKPLPHLIACLLFLSFLLLQFSFIELKQETKEVEHLEEQ